jgi:hypothetical protein
MTDTIRRKLIELARSKNHLELHSIE